MRKTQTYRYVGDDGVTCEINLIPERAAVGGFVAGNGEAGYAMAVRATTREYRPRPRVVWATWRGRLTAFPVATPELWNALAHGSTFTYRGDTCTVVGHRAEGASRAVFPPPQ